MDQSICNVLPVKTYTGNIRTVHFVYEVEHQSLKQPFLRPIYYCYLVTSGNGKLSVFGKEYGLEPGCVFLGFPGTPYQVEGDKSFRYLYISFMGSGAEALFQDLNINHEKPVYRGFMNVIDYWFTAISRLNQINANILAESVLLYTLSFINNKETVAAVDRNSKNVCSMIIDYLQNHFSDPDLSLTKLADMFNYTQKYLSFLFKSVVGVGFNTYLNNLRIEHAQQLIARGFSSINQLATMCGYREASYFSKVFKKIVGTSPIECIKQND